MQIRSSRSDERELIHALHKNTFDPSEADTVAQLAVDLINDPSAQPLLSLVAEQKDIVVGHVIFSAVKIEGNANLSVAILAPLAVSPDCQKQGIGTQLIRVGLEELKSRSVDIVLVYGDPSYYGRTGFHVDHSIAAPYDLQYPTGWQALAFKPGVLSSAEGVANCADALMVKELW